MIIRVIVQETDQAVNEFYLGKSTSYLSSGSYFRLSDLK
jgi:hypothetical protein